MEHNLGDDARLSTFVLHLSKMLAPSSLHPPCTCLTPEAVEQELVAEVTVC